MLLEPDDDVARLRAVWLGFAELRWPWTWTYVEWLGMFLPAFLLTFRAAYPLFQGANGDTEETMAISAVGAFVVAAAAGAIVRSVVAPLVDPDRPLRFIAFSFIRETGRWIWSKGPFDPLVAGIGFGLWNIAMRFVPGPWILTAFVVGFAAHRVARRLVGRFQSAERHWRFVIDRAERSAVPTSISYRITASEAEAA